MTVALRTAAISFVMVLGVAAIAAAQGRGHIIEAKVSLSLAVYLTSGEPKTAQ